jgi:pimeloyl-ACP methyl ester carboxylesterase
LCLHGFPDTAYGFRKLAPHLVAAGYRVIAPFMRGYVPSSIPTDGSYHIGAVMDDALQVRAGWCRDSSYVAGTSATSSCRSCTCTATTTVA